jgi:ATP-binding cassette subfamily C (CFTR/MRP) protein 1
VSGGQRARIAIARALYQDKDLIIMDDPLSALDVNVGESILKQTILQQLHGKTRLIAIHNITYLKHFDKILFIDKGTIRYFGTYNELVKLREFEELVKILQDTSLFQSKDNLEAEIKHHDILEPDEEEVERIDGDSQLMETKMTDNTKITENNQDQSLKTKADASKTTTATNMENELKEKGEVNLKLFFKYLTLGRAMFLLFPFLGATLYIVFSAYRYFFYNEQGALPPETFDRNYFMKVTIILEIGFVTFGTLRGFFCLMFGLDVSRKLNSLIIFRMMHASVIKDKFLLQCDFQHPVEHDPAVNAIIALPHCVLVRVFRHYFQNAASVHKVLQRSHST